MTQEACEKCPRCGDYRILVEPPTYNCGTRYYAGLDYWRYGTNCCEAHIAQQAAQLTAAQSALAEQLEQLEQVKRERDGLREAIPRIEPVAVPDECGWYLCRGVVPYRPEGELSMVYVFRPMWVDPARDDLSWKYPDNSGGDGDRYRVDRGGDWFKIVEAALSTLTKQEQDDGK